MSTSQDDPRVYAALMIPSEALDRGGVEILRAGLVDDMLNVHAVLVFDDPKHWGVVLAEIAEQVADLYAGETKRSREDVVDGIRETFFAELAGVIPARKPKRAAPRRAKAQAKATPKKPLSRQTPKSAPKSASKTTSKTTRKTKRKR
jgi:hypothetical protein